MKLERGGGEESIFAVAKTDMSSPGVVASHRGGESGRPDACRICDVMYGYMDCRYISSNILM